MYGRIYRVVEPKKQRLNAAMSQLKEKQNLLADAKAKLAEVIHNSKAIYLPNLLHHKTVIKTPNVTY